MNRDSVPLTSSGRRRSLFEDESKKEQDGIFKDFPGFLEENSGINYSEEYTGKVASEISQWKMHVEKVLDENEKFKNEKQELENTVVNEDILTSEQFDFFNSINFDHYLRRTKEFCDRAEILMNVLEYKPETEAEQWYRAAQKKIKAETDKI